MKNSKPKQFMDALRQIAAEYEKRLEEVTALEVEINCKNRT